MSWSKKPNFKLAYDSLIYKLYIWFIVKHDFNNNNIVFKSFLLWTKVVKLNYVKIQYPLFTFLSFDILITQQH